MATNFFDQFDAPKEKPEQKTTDNFFDQFDAPTEASLTEEAPKELDSAWDFSGERTLGGRIKAGNIALARDFATTGLSAIEGLSALGEKTPVAKSSNFISEKILDLVGQKERYLENKEWAKSVIPNAINYINEQSALKGDEKYNDLWTTKLGGGAGSLGAFFLATAAGGPAGVTTFSIGSGAGTQSQKLRQAKEAGEDISDLEETAALTLGGAIGLLETYTPLRLLKAIPKDIPAPAKQKIFDTVNNFLKTGAGEVVKTGVGEGSQEVASSILQSLVEMGYNPNAELPTGESLWDDFTIGAVLGGGSQAVRNVVVQNRTNAMSGLEMERERKAREWEDGQNALLRMKLDEMASQRVMEKIDPLSFAEASQRAQSEAFKLPPPSEEEVKQFNAPSAFGAVATPSALGELYALRLIGSLGQNFPSDTSFSVKELPGVEKPITNPDGTQGVEKKPLYAVVDGNGNQYGHTTENPQIASSLESNLNKEVQSKGIRSSILDTLMVSPEGYTPEQTDKLFRYGFRTLSPDSNRVTFAALNDAAGTTTENGYIEDLPLDAVASAKEVRKGRFEVQMPDGTKKYIAGLTASQKLNLKRVNEGLPAVTTFGISEAREALGGDVGRLALPGVSGIQDSLSYGAKVLNGKPIVISEANEVITQRKTTAAEKARAGVDEDGKSVLPDYIEFKTLDEAKRYAGRLNQRTGTSRVMPSEILEGKKGLVGEIKRLLEAKNIVADIGSPEINQLVQAFTGANTFKEMTADDRKLFYNRVRNLPKFEKLTKIPVFKQRLYTPEQFVRASNWQYGNPVMLGKEEVGFAIRMDKTDPDYDAVTQSIVDELNRQNDVIGAENRRFTEEVKPIQEEMQQIMSSFGMSPFMLNLGITLKNREGQNINAEAEGYYDPAFKEIMLAIDAIDTEGNKTQEQRVSALKSVLSHEVLHALRNLDMFTQKEYALLETAVSRTQKPGKDMTYLQWARRPREQGGYFEDSPTVQVEEAIADMVRDFIVDKRVIGGKPRNLIERIIKFFQKIRNMMDGYGFKTFDEVIAAIESGQIGRRYQSAVTEAEDGTRKLIGPVRSLRVSEQMLEKAGRLPARYQKFGDIFEQGPTTVPGQAAQERVPRRIIQEQVAGQTAPVSTDFDPAALEGAEVRMSRKAMESSKDWAYSPLMKAVEQASPKITTAKQWDQWLDANAPKLGVTKDEIDFSGIKDFLALKEGKVSKEDINGYLDNNGVVVKDVMKQSNEEEMADFIDSYVRDESSGITNGYSIVFPDGTMGVYGDPGIFFEGHTPEVMAEKLGIELPDKEIKYQSFTIPGGENYRELLLTLPFREPSMPKGYEVTEMVYDDGSVRYFANTPNTRSSAYKSREEAVTELMRMAEGLKDFRAKLVEYNSSHWNEPNILAHIRMDDRVDQNGDKVLFIEEIQSDWAQEGREYGFSKPKRSQMRSIGEIEADRSRLSRERSALIDKAADLPDSEMALFKEIMAQEAIIRQKIIDVENEWVDATVPEIKIDIPNAPFVTKTKNWVALALKRILALAENEGYKKVAFINGQQSAERYDLRKQIQKIDAKKNIAGTYLLDVEFKQRQGESYAKTDTILAKDEKELQDYVGKELAQKIVKDLNPEINLNRLSVEQNEDFETFAVYSGDFKVSPNFPSIDDARDARDSLRAGIAEPTFPRGSKMYTGVDLAVGGEGMLAFYDSIVPQVAKEVIKKVGGKNLSEVNIDDIGRQLAIEITPEMSERIAAGQVLFSRKAVPGTSKYKAFESLAQSQRGSPEIAMVRAQNAISELEDPSKAGEKYRDYDGSGVYTYLLEHVGDLTHRMSEIPNIQPALGLENVTPKVERSLRILRNGIDIRDMSKIPSIPETIKYSEEHSKLEVFNEMQRLARDSAVAIGNKDFDTARINLQKIADAIADGSYASIAMEYNPDIRYSQKALPDTIEVDGVQRSTRNSEGNFIFQGSDKFTAEEGIRNFWRWFGDSTTVDEEGRPIVYYHGTKYGVDIEEFKSDKGMYWATPSPEFASKLAIGILPNKNVPSVLPVYVRSLNAFDYRNPKHVRALSEQVSKGGYRASIPGLSKKANEMIALEDAKDFKKRLFADYIAYEGSGRERGNADDDNWRLYEERVNDIRALGFDGFHVWESGVDNIASFDNKSLKSALTNTGAYSPEESRISYSRKPIQPHVKEEVQEAVVKAKEDTRRTGTGAVPLYGKDASPDALYVAQNPQLGATLDLDEQAMYSRKNTPIYSPRARDIIDKNTPRPPDETMGKSIIEMMGFPNSRDMWDSFRQAAFFRYGRLERQYRENIEFMTQLADTSAVAAVEMADQSRRFTNEAMRKGVIVYENGMTLIKDFYHNGKKIDGLIGIMAMLHTKEYGNLEELAQAYATAVRGERLNSEGKLTPVSPGELAELKKEVAKFVNPKTGKPVVEEWFNAWQDYNSYTVKFLRDTGILDDAGAELWAKQADYVPFYREDKDGNLVHPRVFGGLHTAGQFKAVGKSDKAINVDMVTAITNNIDTAIAMGMKNVAQQRVIRDQIKLGLAHLLKPGEQVGKRASVSFKVSGKRYTAIIEDPLIYESMLPVSEYDLSNILGKILTAPANFFREIIIRDPGYQIANMFRDTLSAYVITGANIVPIVDTVRNIAADISQLEKLGVVGSNYDLNLDRNGVRDFYEKHMRQTQANAYWHKPWLAVWDGLGRLSERSEAATRLAVYNDVLKRTGNMAEAQYQALSVMNYGRRGGNRMMRLATAIIPFLNARMQGLDKLYQASQGRIGAQYDIGPSGGVQRTASQRKNFQRFAARAAIITAMTILYHSMIEDDDEYLTASPEIRDNYYIIPLLKGDVASGEPGFSMKLPIPFEIGILFKVIPERLLEMAKGEDTPRDFVQSMTRQVKSTLGVNLPQTMLPLYEAYVSNNDSFTGRPVIPTYMENLLPEQQQSFYTNQAIAKAAEAVGMSPMKAEHVISGYMPGVGAYFLQALDSTVREFQGPEMAKPALQWFQYPVVKRFFTTANQPGLQNQFYDLKDQVDGITQTMNKLEEQGRYEELAVFYAKNGHKFDMRSDLNALERQIGRLRDERKIIEQMPIDPEDKRELIEQLNMQINASLLTVPMYRQEAFGKGDRE